MYAAIDVVASFVLSLVPYVCAVFLSDVRSFVIVSFFSYWDP